MTSHFPLRYGVPNRVFEIDADATKLKILRRVAALKILAGQSRCIMGTRAEKLMRTRQGDLLALTGRVS